MHELINIKEIGEDFICTKDKIIQIIKVSPLNYYLMSTLEQKALLKNFQNLLISLNSNFQILIKITKLNQKETYDYLEQKRSEDTHIFNENIADAYVSFLKNIENTNNFNQKDFYLITSIEYNDENFNEKLLLKRDENKHLIYELNSLKNNSVTLKKNELLELIKQYFE